MPKLSQKDFVDVFMTHSGYMWYRAEELMPDFDRIRVLLHSDGRLHWEPGGIFKTTCDIDIGHFPFDTQHCPMLIGAYSYYRYALGEQLTSELFCIAYRILKSANSHTPPAGLQPDDGFPVADSQTYVINILTLYGNGCSYFSSYQNVFR